MNKTENTIHTDRDIKDVNLQHATEGKPTDSKNEVCWYVMRAYKNEVRAEEKLSGEDGLPFFIPKTYVLRTFHGKKSRRLVPAIPSLVFVHASRVQLNAFKLNYPFLQYVMLKRSEGMEYMKVPERQMESFIKVASQTEESLTYFQPEEIEIKAGTRIRVIGGPFDGAEGFFVKIQGKRNRRLVVKLDGVMAISAEVTPDLVEVVK